MPDFAVVCFDGCDDGEDDVENAEDGEEGDSDADEDEEDTDEEEDKCGDHPVDGGASVLIDVVGFVFFELPEEDGGDDACKGDDV